MTKNVVVVIMAGGLGKRMGSNIPKVLHKIAGIPMLCHILLKLKVLANIVNIKKILIVVGKFKKQLKPNLQKQKINYQIMTLLYNQKHLELDMRYNAVYQNYQFILIQKLLFSLEMCR